MTLRVLSPAVDEIAEAAIWFDERRDGLGTEFWSVVDETLSAIEEKPERFGKSEFATGERELRYAYIRRFNYVVHFVIAGDEVQVVSVAHSARQPGYWLRRIQRTD